MFLTSNKITEKKCFIHCRLGPEFRKNTKQSSSNK